MKHMGRNTSTYHGEYFKLQWVLEPDLNHIYFIFQIATYKNGFYHFLIQYGVFIVSTKTNRQMSKTYITVKKKIEKCVSH